MPVDRLALHILRDAHHSETWSWSNWMNSLGQRGTSDEAFNACVEAWYWLIGHGLVASGRGGGNIDFTGCRVTRAGLAALERGLPFIQAAIRLDVDLMPVLEHKVRPIFLLGDYELAALAAMREVEIEIRSRADLGPELFGTALVQEAFKAEGPLYSRAIHKAESVAQLNLFSGAIGMFKNPPSHRRVDYTDPTQASEVVLLADLLLRILESINP